MLRAETPSIMSPCVGTNLRITASASQGGRRYMEDRVHIEVSRKADGTIDWVYCAVYDGHGGPEASEFVRRNLLNNIRANPSFESDNEEEFLEVVRQGFVQTHFSMLKVVDSWPKTSSGYPCTAGTTASCVFIRRGKLFIGHVGDSAVFLGKSHSGDDFGARLQAIRLTVDHKPDSAEELHRIESAGGAVMNKAGINRVVWNRPKRGHTGPVTADTPVENIPFLAVARALGDLWSFNHLSGEYVVSPDPDVAVVTLDPDMKCLVLGSDGLTNVMNAQQMMDTVSIHEWKDLSKIYGKEAEDKILDRPVHNNHAHWLLRQTMRNWGSLRADNISIIVILFDDPEKDIKDDHTSVTHSGRDLCFDEELTIQPEAMVRCNHRTNQRLRTTPVDLAYSGMIDKNFKMTNYKGPGFVVHRNVREGSEERCSPAKPRALRNLMSSASSCHSEPSSRSSTNNLLSVARITGYKPNVASADASPPQPAHVEALVNPADVSISEDALLPSEAPEHSIAEPDDPEPTSTADEERPESRMEIRPEDRRPQHDTDGAKIPKEEHETCKENGDCGENKKPEKKPKFTCKKHGGNCEKAIAMNEEHERKRALRALSKNQDDSLDMSPQVKMEGGDSSFIASINSLTTFPRLGSASALSPTVMLSAMRSLSSTANASISITPFRTMSLDSPGLSALSPLAPKVAPQTSADKTPMIKNGGGSSTNRRFASVNMFLNRQQQNISSTTSTAPSATPGRKRPPQVAKSDSESHMEPHRKRSRVLDFFHSFTGLLGVGGGSDKRGSNDKSGAK
ncbi:hypothetical protein L596_025874 [Steinernema carpocapsae]|nr:hypothetical protein L596_025874 [Steinernema carpocapsae]